MSQSDPSRNTGSVITNSPDYDSVSTYLPCVVLLLWLTIHAGASCLTQNDEWLSHILVGSFALNWWFTPRATGHWNLVRYGVGIWLSWIAYGEVLHCDNGRNPGNHTQISHMLASILFVISGSIATLVNNHSGYLLAAAGFFVAGLMLPNPESSFARCSCPVRVIKAACFALLHGYMYLCRERCRDRLEKHFQAVTLSSGWVLVSHHHLLWIAPLQCLYTAYHRGDLGNIMSLSSKDTASEIDTENPITCEEVTTIDEAANLALQQQHTRTNATPVTPPSSTDDIPSQHLELLRNHNRSATSQWRGMQMNHSGQGISSTQPVYFQSPAEVDVARLQRLSAGDVS